MPTLSNLYRPVGSQTTMAVILAQVEQQQTYTNKSGGGLAISGSSNLVVDNCQFIGNYAEQGGALSVNEYSGPSFKANSKVSISLCNFYNNTGGSFDFFVK